MLVHPANMAKNLLVDINTLTSRAWNVLKCLDAKEVCLYVMFLSFLLFIRHFYYIIIIKAKITIRFIRVFICMLLGVSPVQLATITHYHGIIGLIIDRC